MLKIDDITLHNNIWEALAPGLHIQVASKSYFEVSCVDSTVIASWGLLVFPTGRDTESVLIFRCKPQQRQSLLRLKNFQREVFVGNFKVSGEMYP